MTRGPNNVEVPPRLAVCSVAALVFLLGFGGLWILWTFGSWPHDLRGFWSYRSATIGDGILLPLFAGALAALLSRMQPAPRERRQIIGAAFAGAVAGAVLQWTWLADPHPELNWTLPSPHRFNAAGVYHAAFLVAASAAAAGAAACFLLRLRHLRLVHPDKVPEVLGSDALAVVTGAPLAFIVLLLIDAPGPSDSGVASLGVAMIAWGAFVLMIAFVVRRQAPSASLPILFATVFAIALGLGARFWPALDPDIGVFGIVCSALVGAGIGHRTERLRLATSLAAGSVLFAATNLGLDVLSTSGAWGFVVVAVGTALAIALGWLPRRSSHDGKDFLWLIGVGSPFVGLLLVASFRDRVLPVAGDLLFMGAEFALLGPLSKYVAREFGKLIQAETELPSRQSRPMSNEEEQKIERAGEDFWNCAVFFVLPSAAVAVMVVASAARMGGWDAGSLESDSLHLHVGASLVAALLAGSLIAVSRAFRRAHYARPLALAVAAASWCWVAFLAIHSEWSSAFMVEAVVAALVVFVVSAEDLWANVYGLHALPTTPGGWAAILGVAASHAGAVLWLVTTGLDSFGRPLAIESSIELALSVGFAAGTLSFAVGGLLWQSTDGYRLTLHRPEQNILQGQFLLGAFVFILIVLPLIGVRRPPHGLVVSIGIILTFGVIGCIGYLTGNNRAHRGRESERGDSPSALSRKQAAGASSSLEEVRLARLSLHIKFQNCTLGVALVAALVWLVAYVAPFATVNP